MVTQEPPTTPGRPRRLAPRSRRLRRAGRSTTATATSTTFRPTRSWTAGCRSTSSTPTYGTCRSTRAPSRRRAAGWSIGGVALAAYSALFGVAIGFTGYDDTFKANNPGAFQALQRLTSSLPTLATALAGRPMIAGVQAPNGVAVTHVDYTTFGPEGASLTLQQGEDATVTVISPGERDARLRFGSAQETAAPLRVVASSAGRSTAADVRAGTPVVLPVHLRRGATFVRLALAPKAGDPPLSGPAAVQLTDVRLR